MTKIEWTKNADGTAGKTWNPIVGCRRVSAGCENCYAERTVHRGMSPQHKGLTVLGKRGPRWNGEFNVAEKRFDEPLRRKKPTTWFVNSLSDLFFEPLPNELIAAIFGIMAATPQHTYQVLTKRPERAREWFAWVIEQTGPMTSPVDVLLNAAADRVSQVSRVRRTTYPWPLPNVQLGVSVENQATADERIPVLLELPNALPWVSYEPALGPVDFSPWLMTGSWSSFIGMGKPKPGLDWIVVGGESGPGARSFDLGWARKTLEQCEAARVPVFVKQLGARPYVSMTALHPQLARLDDRKGGDPSEWPQDLRVRQMPQ